MSEPNQRTYRISFLYILKLSDESIAATYDFRTHRLAWHEITVIEPNRKGRGLILKDAGNTQIYINPNLLEYEEIVAFIRQKCSAVWPAQNIEAFHYDAIGPAFLLLNTSLVFFLAFSELSQGNNIPGSALGLGLALLCMGLIVLTTRRQMYFSGDNIVLEYWVRKKYIHAREIVAFQNYDQMIVKIGSRSINFIFSSALLLKLVNHKTINIGGVKEGKQILETSLKRWLKTYTSVVVD